MQCVYLIYEIHEGMKKHVTLDRYLVEKRPWGSYFKECLVKFQR